jgi:hypothetical protein
MTYQGKRKIELDRLSETSGWTLHDARRYFASSHARIGTPIHVTEKLLDHVSGSFGGIVAVYQRHNYLAEMAKAMEAYDADIVTLVR